MKKSRIENLLIEPENIEEPETEVINNSEYEIESDDPIQSYDSKGVRIVDLTKKYKTERKEKPKKNFIKELGAELKRTHKSKSKKSKLRRISSILLVSIVVTVFAVVIWNNAQMKEIENIRDTIDDSYNTQELNMDKVERLGTLFTIHDEDSFNWVIDNIDMTDDLKSTLFTPDSNGKYTYRGTGSKVGPTYECLEIQYEQSTNPLSYLANFKVTLANGGVRYYLVVCKFRELNNGKYILTKFYTY